MSESGPRPDPMTILTALKQSLVAARTRPDGNTTTWNYPLNETALPDGGDGDPGAVRTALVSALAPGSTAPLTITSAGDPAYAEQAGTLTLTGTSAVLTGASDTAVTLVFSVAADATLVAIWTAVPPAGWTLATAFVSLAETPFEYLPVSGAMFAAATTARTDPDWFLPLTAGLQYQATLAVRGDLTPATGEPGQTGAFYTRVGGPVLITSDGRPQFTWTAESNLGALTIPRVGQASLTLAGGRPALSCTPVPGPSPRDGGADGDAAASPGQVEPGPAAPSLAAPSLAAPRLAVPAVGGALPPSALTAEVLASAPPSVTTSLTIAGQISIGGKPVACVLDLPTALTDMLTLTSSDTAVSAADTAAALTDAGAGDVLGGQLPTALLALTGVSLTGYTVTFGARGNGPTTTAVTLGLGSGTWPLVPALNLTLSGLGLTGTVIRAPGYRANPVVSWGATLTGRLTLGAAHAHYSVTATVPPRGPWYVEVVDAGAPALSVLAGLTALTEADVLHALPASLVAQGSVVTLSKVGLLVAPTTKTLAEVAFTIGQTAPWPMLGGKLTLSGWRAELSIARDGQGSWAVSGAVRGSVSLTAAGQATTVNLDLPVPISDGQLWTLSLQPGSSVDLPTVGQILGLLGGDPTMLPANVASWGGLVLTHFAVSVDPAAAAVKHLAFACAQANDWVIIAPSSLVIKDVAAALAFLPDSSPVRTAGRIGGTLMLAGTPVDVLVNKSDFSGSWQLAAAYENPVTVPGFAALDAWLDPTGSQAALAGLPLAQGIQLSEVNLAFAGDATGALTSVGFTISAPGQWPVLPGYLSLTYLAARLKMPYPVNAAEVTGTVAAVVTLAGTDVAVSATKPSSGTPWTFSGTLLEGMTIDLIDAADSMTAQALALPADATTYGLPASIAIVAASVRVVPDTGEFHLAGQVDVDWTFSLGSAQLKVRSISGTIDIARRDEPVAATISGAFAFAGIDTVLTLTVGGADAQTVLTGVVTPAKAAGIQINGLTDGVGAHTDAQKWAAVAPAGLAPLAFTTAAVYLNLTASQFAVYGGISWGSGLVADGLVYLSANQSQPWTYAVALSFGQRFRFGALIPALAAVDDHVRVTSAHLVVCDLAGESLGDLASTTTALLSRIAPAATAPLAGLTGQALRISTGTYFAAQIDFASVSLFARILQIGHEGDTTSIWLEALIDSASPANTIFSAGLPDITIVDTILLTHTAGNQYLLLRYTPAQAGRVELIGQLKLTGIFGSLNYAFDATLTIDDTGLTSTITQAGQDISSPFGVPNIVLSQPKLVVTYVWAVPAGNGHPATPQTSSLELTGRALIGPAPGPGQQDGRVGFGARLVLLSGKPALLDISVDSAFSLAGFITRCFTGSAATWTYIDVALLAGTHLYYYDPGADPGHTLVLADGTTPSAGFNIDAKLRVTLVTEITLHATLNVQRDPSTGAYTTVVAAIRLDNPLDLIFAQLAGDDPPQPGQPYTGGPLLAFTGGATPSFLLKAGINFLGSAFLAVDVGVAKGADGGTIMTGRLTARQPLAPFGTLGCGFSYTTHPGRAGEFAIEGWPDFTWARNLVDLVASIKKLADTSPGSVCGTLADFVANSAFTSNYSLHPAVTVAGTDLVFAFTGTYTLTLTAMQTPFLELALPAFNVHIPSTTTWETLPDALATGVVQASGEFAKSLLSQPDKIAMFLAIVVGPKAVSVALELACNRLVDGAVAAATEAAVDAIDAAGGVAAAGAIAAAAAAITTSIALSGSGGGGGGGGGGGKPATPHLRSVAYADGKVTGAWDAAVGAAGYSFELLRPDGSVLTRADLGMAMTGALTVDPTPLPAGTYTARVQSRRGPDVSGWSGLPLTKYAAPVVSLSYSEPMLAARWTDLGATTYTVQYFDPAGRQIGTDLAVAAGTGHSEVSVPEPVAGAYTAHMRADRPGQFPGAYGALASFTVLSLPPPPVPTIGRDGNVLTVTWAAKAGLGYDLKLTDNETILATAQVAAGSARLTPSSPLITGQSYQLGLRARGSNGLSPWRTTTFAAWDVPVAEPASATLTDVVGTLTGNWDAVNVVAGSPAPVYRLDLIDLAHPDQPVGSRDGLTVTSSAIARSDGQAPAIGARYAVQVRAEVAGKPGPWATSPTLPIVGELSAPTGVVLTAAGTRLGLVWTLPPNPPGLSGSLRFSVNLLSGGSIVGSVSGLTSPTWTPVRTDGRAPQPGESYQAEVWATAPGHVGQSARSSQVRILDRVVILNTAYYASMISAQWTPSSLGATGYELQATWAPDPTQVLTSFTGAAHGLIPLQGKAGGLYSLQVRPTLPGSVGEWSLPQPVNVTDPATGLYLSCDGAHLTLAWAPPSIPSDYLAAVMMTNGIVVVGPQRVTQGFPTTLTWPLTGLTPETAYLARVAAASDIGNLNVLAAFVLPATPTGANATYDGTNVTVTWAPPPETVTDYLITVRAPDSTQITSIIIPATANPFNHNQTKIPTAAFNLGPATYTITIQARTGTITSTPTNPIPINLTTAPELSAPTGVVLTAAGTRLGLVWMAPPNPAGLSGVLSFSVNLVSGGSIVGSVSGLSTASWIPVRADGRAPQPGEYYQAEVWATAPGYVGKSALSAQVRVLDQVVLFKPNYYASMISAQWTSSAFGATGYELQAIWNPDPTQVITTVTGASSGLIPLQGKAGGLYAVQVRATLPGSVGAWSASQPAPVTDPATGLYVFSDGSHLTLAWAPSSVPSDYLAVIMSNGMVVVGPQLVLQGFPTTLTWPLDHLAPETAYVARVASSPSSSGNLNVLAAFMLPGAPRGVSAHFDGTDIIVGWTPPVGSVTDYLITVRGPDNTPVTSVTVPAAADPFSHNQAKIPATGLSHGSVTYTIVMQARIGALASTPTTPIPINLTNTRRP